MRDAGAVAAADEEREGSDAAREHQDAGAGGVWSEAERAAAHGREGPSGDEARDVSGQGGSERGQPDTTGKGVDQAAEQEGDGNADGEEVSGC